MVSGVWSAISSAVPWRGERNEARALAVDEHDGGAWSLTQRLYQGPEAGRVTHGERIREGHGDGQALASAVTPREHRDARGVAHRADG